MNKSIFVVVCALVGFATLLADEQSTKVFIDGNNNARAFQLEERKIALEERKVYLASLQGSKMTEEKATAMSLSILKHLKDYPQGKKARHMDEDVTFLVETLASIQKPTP